MQLTNEELLNVNGGNLYSVINSLTKFYTFCADLGRAVGSTLKGLFGKNYCA